MPKAVSKTIPFPYVVRAPPAPKGNLKAPKVAMLQTPLSFPRSKAQRQLPISRTHTFVFAPIEVFAGTKKRTI